MRGFCNLYLCAAVSAVVGFLGCGKETTEPEPETLTESALVGIWIMAVSTPAGPMKIVLDVKDDLSMVASVKKRMAVSGSDSVDFEIQRDYMSWSLKAGQFSSTKTSCQAANDSGQLESRPCQEPVSETYPVAVSGKNLTAVKGTMTYVFIKD